MAGIEKPQLQEVYAALSILYSSRCSDKHATEKASTYLAHIQQSVWAWELADTLLSQNKGKESNYFAATTLRNKIQREFRELPVSSHISLRDSLLNHLTSFKDGEAVLLTQLSLALADLALQMATWSTIVHDLVARFSSDPKSWNVLLECLTVLPEEIGSRYLKLGAARRDDIQTQLQSNSATVFSFLEFASSNASLLSNPDFSHIHIFRCWGSWLVLGEFDSKLVAQGNIIRKLFEIIVNSPPSHTCYESACDAVCSATYAMEDLHSNKALAVEIVPRLASLQSPLVTAINSEDLDIVNNITRMLTEAGESLIAPLTKTPGKELGDFTIVNLILTAIKYPDYTVAEISFNFWFQLAENIFRAPDSQTVETYKPVFVELLNTIVKLCELYDEFDETTFDDEDFAEFREKCNDLMKDTVYILGVRSVLEMFLQELNEPSNTWKRAESLLFCSSCVIKMLNSTDTDVIYRYLNTVLSIPTDSNFNLRIICMRMLGECAEWVTCNEQILNPVLQRLLHELKDKKVTKHCISSLEKLCTAGSQALQPHLLLLIQIVEEAKDVPHNTFTHFIECVTGVCCYLPLAQHSEHLMRIAQPSLNALSISGTDPVKHIDCISGIFRGYKGDVGPTDEHPLQGVLVASWPHLSNALATCANSVNSIERVCRCIRYGLRAVGKRTPDILAPLADKLTVLYSTKPHSCVLYLSSVLVDEFSTDPRFEDGLLGLFSAMGPKTFEILSAPQGLERNPDTVDDFYRLCSRYMQHLGNRVATSSIMTHLIDMATQCLTLEHKDAQCSAIKFIDAVLHRANSGKCPHCKGHVTRCGQDMMNKIILGVSGGLPMSLLSDLCLLLHDLLSLLGEEARGWLRQALSSVPIGTYVTQQHVEALYKSLTTANTTPRDVVRVCKEFNQCFT